MFFQDVKAIAIFVTKGNKVCSTLQTSISGKREKTLMTYERQLLFTVTVNSQNLTDAGRNETIIVRLRKKSFLPFIVLFLLVLAEAEQLTRIIKLFK